MKTNEIIAAMQKNLNAEMQKTLTALKEQQANEVSELEAYKAKQKEKAETLKQSILSAFAAFMDEDEVTAPEPVESPVEDKEKASAEAKRMEEEAAAALKQAKELAEKEAAERKRKADVEEAKALAAKALAEKEENERKQRAAVAEAAIQAAKDRKAAEDAAKAKAEAAKAAEEAAAQVDEEEEEDEGDGSMSEEEYNRLEILLDKYQSPIAKRAIQELKDAGHEETLKPRVNDYGWFCRTEKANKMIVDVTDRIAEAQRKALFADGSSFLEHQKELGVITRAQASAKSFAKQAKIFELCPKTITDIPEANQMGVLADAARTCNVENLFDTLRFKEFLAKFGLTSMAQLTGDNVAKFYEYMFEQCTYDVFKEKEE